MLADTGSVRVFGYDIERHSMQARQLINRVSADPSFFRQMNLPGKQYDWTQRMCCPVSLETLSGISVLLIRFFQTWSEQQHMDGAGQEQPPNQ